MQIIFTNESKANQKEGTNIVHNKFNVNLT